MYRKEWKGMEKKVPPSNSPSMGRIREDFFICICQNRHRNLQVSHNVSLKQRRYFEHYTLLSCSLCAVVLSVLRHVFPSLLTLQEKILYGLFGKRVFSLYLCGEIPHTITIPLL
jgi:hypothetical protein